MGSYTLQRLKPTPDKGSRLIAAFISETSVEVEDNADGMDETTEENLFEEFFSTKGDKGTGLGLMVVDRIVRNHKGKIEILTRPGIGSLFRTIFPI